MLMLTGPPLQRRPRPYVLNSAGSGCLGGQKTEALAGFQKRNERPVMHRYGKQSAIPLDEWHEDDGDKLWWKFPITEPPYVGSPLDTNWPGYHTHWTDFDVPDTIGTSKWPEKLLTE